MSLGRFLDHRIGICLGLLAVAVDAQRQHGDDDKEDAHCAQVGVTLVDDGLEAQGGHQATAHDNGRSNDKAAVLDVAGHLQRILKAGNKGEHAGNAGRDKRQQQNGGVDTDGQLAAGGSADVIDRQRGLAHQREPAHQHDHGDAQHDRIQHKAHDHGLAGILIALDALAAGGHKEKGSQ